MELRRRHVAPRKVERGVDILSEGHDLARAPDNEFPEVGLARDVVRCLASRPGELFTAGSDRRTTMTEEKAISIQPSAKL